MVPLLVLPRLLLSCCLWPLWPCHRCWHCGNNCTGCGSLGCCCCLQFSSTRQAWLLLPLLLRWRWQGRCQELRPLRALLRLPWQGTILPLMLLLLLLLRRCRRRCHRSIQASVAAPAAVVRVVLKVAVAFPAAAIAVHGGLLPPLSLLLARGPGHRWRAQSCLCLLNLCQALIHSCGQALCRRRRKCSGHVGC